MRETILHATAPQKLPEDCSGGRWAVTKCTEKVPSLVLFQAVNHLPAVKKQAERLPAIIAEHRAFQPQQTRNLTPVPAE